MCAQWITPTRPTLLNQLDRQIGYLQRSCALLDAGYEDEAARLAVTLRVLLHDTRTSHSLLSQLGVLDQVLFEDTSWQEPAAEDGVLVVSFSSGLVDLDMFAGRWVAPLGNRSSRPPAPFEQWWKEPVVVIHGQEERLSRWDLIDFMAHQDGGAHVDRRGVDERYFRLTQSGTGVMTLSGVIGLPETINAADLQPPAGNAAAVSVRQVAHEVLATLGREDTARLIAA